MTDMSVELVPRTYEDGDVVAHELIISTLSQPLLTAEQRVAQPSESRLIPAHEYADSSISLAVCSFVCLSSDDRELTAG